ncbi:MAG: type IX secretion system membrane protein PorP/SprF [Flavobacteriales bacterium]|nr:type IX secretion system membrane protein PorP/SprF [Flavobacteriales bacterium]
MKNILIAISLTLLGAGAYAQQLPFTSQYMFNDYLINPAVGGSLDYMPIALSVRSQWAGLEGSPKTQFLSGHTKLGKKIGVGGYVFNDEAGPIKEQGIQLSYSYHLQIGDESNLSFGLGGMLFSHSISTSKLKFDEPDDMALSNIKHKAVSPDLSFGVLYYTDKYKVGFSVPQLFQNNLYDNLSSENQNTLVRHYFLHGEVSFDVSDNFDVVPGFLFKMVSGAPMQVDVNVKGVYQKKYWLGLSYRHEESVVTMLGLAYKNLQFGYSYDFTLTDIKDYSSGTHELYLGLIIGKKEEKKSSAKFD